MTKETDDIGRNDVNERDFTDNVVEAYQTYDELVANILKSGKDYDMAAIEKAYLFANVGDESFDHSISSCIHEMKRIKHSPVRSIWIGLCFRLSLHIERILNNE